MGFQFGRKFPEIKRKIALRVGYCALPLIDLEADCEGGLYYDLGVKWGGGENIGKG